MALIKLKHFSSALGMNMSVEIILPEADMGIGVTGNDVKLEDLPVLYMLHGTSDDQTICTRRTSIERYVADTNLVVVMPTTHRGAYTNQVCGGFRYFDYIAKELPTVCQSYLPISSKREKNFIGGLSMGGYGALKIGFRCADQFSHIIALSPGCERIYLLPEQVHQCKSFQDLLALRDQLSENDFRYAMHFFANFGSPDQYMTSQENNLFRIAEKAVACNVDIPKIFMTCGYDDTITLQGGRQFVEHMNALHIPHFYDEHAGGHEWSYWDLHMQRALQWLPL